MASLIRCGVILLTIVSFLVFAGVVTFFYFGQYADEIALDFYMYNRTLVNLRKYTVKITPSDWTFWTWTAVFGWQLLWLFYALILMCRRYGPRVLTPFFFVFNILAFGFTLAWVTLLGEDFKNIALGFIAGTPACLFIALAIVYSRFYDLLLGMNKFPTGDQIAIESLVINGIALYASWGLFNAFQGVAVVLTYTAGVSEHISSTIVLTGLGAALVFWFCLDNFVFWKFTLFTVTPYAAMVVGFTGIFTEFWEKEDRNSIFNVILLGVSSFMILLKLAHIIGRIQRNRKKSRRHVLQAEDEKIELWAFARKSLVHLWWPWSKRVVQYKYETKFGTYSW